MRTQLLVFISIILSINCYAQISFEKGYFIDESDQKIECLIKNIDWRNNPTEFEYKLSEDATGMIATIESTKEFGVYDMSKYKRYKVNIDRSNDKMEQMSDVRNPIFQKEVLFLKVLVEGEATLFQYKDSNLERFFYESGDSEIEQLVYKPYLRTLVNNLNVEETEIRKNNKFRQQLWTDVKCEDVSMTKMERIRYEKRDLVKYFMKYNGLELETSKRNLFNLYIRPGLNRSSMKIFRPFTSDIDFGAEFKFRVGLEAEFVLPFNKNKWALLFEPNYSSYKASQEYIYVANSTSTATNERTTNVMADFSLIGLPLGIRYYLFISDASKLFLNVSGNFNISILSSAIQAERIDILNLDANTLSLNFIFGIGYNYNNRLSLEFRQETAHDRLGNYVSINSKYNVSSLILGINVF